MSDTKRCVNYCGSLSDFFSVDSGIRQGCPFPPLAFVLAIERLAIKIRDVQNIKEIRNWSLNNVPYIEDIIKIALYADDIALFLNDENDMRHAVNVIHEFSVFSGLKVNKTNAHAMWPRSNKNRTLFGFNWKKKLKILGVYFGSYKCASHIDENWSERIVKIKRLGEKTFKRCWKNMNY